MARGAGPAARDRLVDVLIAVLQLLIDAWRWLASLLRGEGLLPLPSSRRQRGSRRAVARGCAPARPTTIGIVFAEPSPEDISMQEAANMAAW